jgi:hypothetical protein
MLLEKEKKWAGTTPARAAAEKSISIVVGSSVQMTDGELILAIQNVKESMSRLGPEKELNTQDWRKLLRLKQELQLLEGIQKAREVGNNSLETRRLTEYYMLKEEKNMNPFVSYLMKLKFRSHIWG